MRKGYLIQRTFSILVNQAIQVEIPGIEPISLELNDKYSPKTVKKIIDSLPFTVSLNLWGEEIYTDETPIEVEEENSKEIVELYDVAYWPTGKAICLFYGPTPIGKKGEIKPYSAVNIIGKIAKPDKNILSKLAGKKATFKKSS